MDRAGAKNAIGKGMLRGLQSTFESIQKDASAKVVMIGSAVPKIFCAGADLKVMHQFSIKLMVFLIVRHVTSWLN